VTSPTVPVVARHGTYAIELRRAGMTVIEADTDEALTEPLSACVIEAVRRDSPAPAGWDRLVPMLTRDGAPATFAVVSLQPPAWLLPLIDHAVLVSAPISGRQLAARVTAAVGPSAPAARHAEPPDDDVIDLGLAPAQVIDLVDELDREAALAVQLPTTAPRGATVRAVPAPRGPAIPLRMARAREVVDRLIDFLPGMPTLRDVCEDVAGQLDERLGADVAVLVSRRPDAPWSVLAGVGLRPLEWRPVPRDPQVLSLLTPQRPILRVETSDDVRQSAGDLPCASRNHLLVARHPAVDLLVLAGREERSFTREDVRTLGGVLERLDGLDDALALCGLAERLLPYLDT
jgi:transposase